MRTRNVVYAILGVVSFAAIAVLAVSYYTSTRIGMEYRGLSDTEQAWVSRHVEGVASSLSISAIPLTTDRLIAKADLAIIWANGDLKAATAAGPAALRPFLADPYALYVSKSIENDPFLSEWKAFIAPDALPKKRGVYTVTVAGNDDQTLIAFTAALMDAADGPEAASALYAELEEQAVIDPQGMIIKTARWHDAVEILRVLRTSGTIPSDWTGWDAASVFRTLRDGKTATSFARFSERATYSVLEYGNLSFKPIPVDALRTDRTVVARVLATSVTRRGETKRAAAKLVEALAAGGFVPAPFEWKEPFLDFGPRDSGRMERGYKAWLVGAAALFAVSPAPADSYAHAVAEAVRAEARK